MFLLVPAHPCSLGQRAIKLLCKRLYVCVCLQMDGAKLVSINSYAEHAFIVEWLKQNAKQGYMWLSFFVPCVFCLVIMSAIVSFVKLYSELQRLHIFTWFGVERV